MNRLRACREKMDLSQKQVAIEVGVKPPTVSQWESGIKIPSRENIKKLSRLYGVTADYLMGISEDIEISNSFDLTAAEIQLVLQYRKLTKDNKSNILSNIQFLLNQQSKEKETTYVTA